MEKKTDTTIAENEEAMLICSPQGYNTLRSMGYDGMAVIATWVQEESCVLVRRKDWEKLIDSGEVWGPKEEKDDHTGSKSSD